MGGGSADGDRICSEVRSVVLIGRTGNGKSATGNSLVGTRVFESFSSSAGVTSTCEMHSRALGEEKILNVIDTPGLFDFSGDTEFIGNEILKCMNMANDGIHAVLLVLSVRSRFSKEEEAAITCLQKLFCTKITDYMIVVFTGGDDLEEHETLDDYLGRNCPEALKKTLKMCGKRCVLFDNKTRDESKKSQQLKQLLSLIDEVVHENSGIPYTNEMFLELKNEEMKQKFSEFSEDLQKSHEEKLMRMKETIELRFNEVMDKLQQQLADEQASRREAEEKLRDTQNRSDDEIRKIKEEFERTQREADELRGQKQQGGTCNIL